MLILKIPYLRNSNTGDLSRTVNEAQYGDGYVASAPAGINPDQEVWQIVTPPLPVKDARKLLDMLQATYGKGFIWRNKPSGATASHYWIRPQKVQWQPKSSNASLSLTIESYKGIIG
jgi:phage-related protein